MTSQTVTILGGGAIGLVLAVQLAHKGVETLVVRTSNPNIEDQLQQVHVELGSGQVATSLVRMVSLARVTHLEGLMVVAAKAFANEAIAAEIKAKGGDLPVILLQNGLGVEQPFLDAGFSEVYRCVLYSSSQIEGKNSVRFRSVNPSPIGLFSGSAEQMAAYVDLITTPEFPFRTETAIQEAIWQKLIINTVYNSICTLLDTDTGVFHRDPAAAVLARAVVSECMQVVIRLDLNVEEGDVLDTIFMISRETQGQIISTLQDIRNGRPTEIESLNLAIARLAAAQTPPISVERTKLLGELIWMKSQIHQATVD